VLAGVLGTTEGDRLRVGQNLPGVQRMNARHGLDEVDLPAPPQLETRAVEGNKGNKGGGEGGGVPRARGPPYRHDERGTPSAAIRALFHRAHRVRQASSRVNTLPIVQTVLALISALASILALFAILIRVGRVLEQIDGRIDGVNGRIDGVNGRIDGVNGRIDGLDSRMDRLERRFDGLDHRLDRIEDKIDRHIEYHLPR
jgi:hypothetical protein